MSGARVGARLAGRLELGPTSEIRDLGAHLRDLAPHGTELLSLFLGALARTRQAQHASDERQNADHDDELAGR